MSTATTAAFPSFRHNGGVPALSGKSVMPVNNFAIYNQSATYPGAQSIHGKMLHPTGSTIHQFTIGSRIRIFRNNDGQIRWKKLLHHVLDRNNSRERKIGCIFDGTSVMIGIGRPHSYANQTVNQPILL